jgi:hypothetical protein
VRQWVSIRGPGGLRFGQSIGPEDFGPPKLPSWRRYELRKQLQTAATAKGKTITIADCDCVIDRTLQIATVDRNGLVLHLRGDRRFGAIWALVRCKQLGTCVIASASL